MNSSIGIALHLKTTLHDDAILLLTMNQLMIQEYLKITNETQLLNQWGRAGVPVALQIKVQKKIQQSLTPISVLVRNYAEQVAQDSPVLTMKHAQQDQLNTETKTWVEKNEQTWKSECGGLVNWLWIGQKYVKTVQPVAEEIQSKINQNLIQLGLPHVQVKKMKKI